MVSELFDKIYGELDPKEYFCFELQKDLAKEAIDYYLIFNNLNILDINLISYPYIFTKNEIYDKLVYILNNIQGNISTYSISPDANGGATAIYLGDQTTILTVDIDKEGQVSVEYIHQGVMGKAIFNSNKKRESIIKSINNILTDLWQ